MIGHRVVLRPRDLAENADLAAALIRRHWRAFAKLLPWTLVPALAVALLAPRFELGFWASLGLSAIGTGLGGGTFVVLCGDLMLGDAVSLPSVQRRYLARVVPFTFARIVGWIVTTISVGFAFANAAFVPESSLLEKGTTGQALTRSGALMRSVGGRSLTFGFLAWVVTLVGVVAGELARYYARDLFGLANTRIELLAHPLGWAGAVGLALVTPYLEAVRFLLYIDARTRREGWDLQVQFNALTDLAEKAHESRPTTEAA